MSFAIVENLSFLVGFGFSLNLVEDLISIDSEAIGNFHLDLLGHGQSLEAMGSFSLLHFQQ